MRDWTTFCEGSCCRVFPILNDLFLRHQGQAERPYELVETEGDVIPITEDGWCIFLDSGKRCAIYPDRPQICRMYGEIEPLKCTRLRGLRDDFIGEAMSAPLNAKRYNPKGVAQKSF